MGWTFITFPESHCADVKHWKMPGSEDLYHWRPTPHMSSDSDYIPEMLAFLHAEWPWLNIDTYPTEQGRGVTVQGKNDCGDKTPIAEGDTLSEALAKLVVAVGDAKRSAE